MSAQINIQDGSIIKHAPLAHLSVFMNPPAGWKMAVLEAYLDDSGDPGQEWLTIAGFSFLVGKGRSGRESESEAFEREWKQALDFAGIPYLHMKEMNSDKPEFKQLKSDPGKEVAFFSRINEILDKRIDACVASSVKISELNVFNDKYSLNLDPYALGIYGCLLNFSVAHSGHKDEIEILVDKFSKSRKRSNLAFDYEETDTTILRQGSIVFAKTDILKDEGAKSIYQLQAADYLAWETCKHLKDNTDFEPSYETRQDIEKLNKDREEFEVEYEKVYGVKPRVRQSYSRLINKLNSCPLRVCCNIWMQDDLEMANKRHPSGWAID